MSKEPQSYVHQLVTEDKN